MNEAALHGIVADMLRLYAVPGLIPLHIPNEGQRAPRTGAFLKRMGMMPGAADWSITLPGGRQHWLELKSPVGRQTPAQIAFEALCCANGSPYALARTPEEAASILHAWGALTENPLDKRRAA